MRTNEINNELNEIKKVEDSIVRKHLKYKTSRRIFTFQKQYEAIWSFDYDILSVKIRISETDEKQCNLLNIVLDFNDKARPKPGPDNKKKSNAHESVNALYEGRELFTLNSFKSGIFPIKSTQGKRRPSDLVHKAKV